MTKKRLLIVDDEATITESLSAIFNAWGYETATAANGFAALSLIESFNPSIVISDVSMPGLDGFGLLREMRARQLQTSVILLTGRGSIEMALRAVKEEGAFHYFEKPVESDKLRAAVDRAIAIDDARLEAVKFQQQLRERSGFGELVGRSEPMRRIYDLIEQIATSSASVLITGESGTGKELVARTIHTLSQRRDAPFVAINCSAIPETLMESELFGHEKGAFTGAASRRQGCFEMANNGTLLLDEIAEMPTLLQTKLLRVLEERRVRRLGSAQEIGVDVRVLAATNKNTHDAIEQGALREDLLYRLNVITLELPPLRERLDDLPLLVHHLVAQMAERHDRPARLVSPAGLEVLRSHHWPGNVRELRNVIERAVIICSGEQIERRHFAPYPVDQRTRVRWSEDTVAFPIGTPIEEVERQMILRTLQKTGNNKTRAAALLRISLKTLHNKLKLYRERGLLPDTLARENLANSK